MLAGALAAAVLVLPFSLTLPALSVTLPSRTAVIQASTEALTDAAPVASASAPAPGTTPAPAPDESSALSAAALLAIAWFGGLLVCAGRLFAGLLRIRRVTALASPVDDDRWTNALDAVARRYGLKRDIRVARTDSADLLATWGIRRPHVLLPRQSHAWPADRIHVVLCHELAHIRRHDWLVQMLAEAVRAILWFNPLAWMICTRLRRESEQACDDEVLAMGVGGVDYAGQLLDLARQCRRPGSMWASALPMAHPSTLERRITAMLNPRLDRRVPTRRALALVGTALLIITLPAAALRARQAGPATLAGTVYDVMGGVMPGVEVTLTDANQVAKKTQSNASGRFEFAAVAPGKYVLSAALRGFRPLRHELDLTSPSDWNRAVILQLGNLQESISVSASRMPAAAPGAGVPAPVRVGGSVRVPQKVYDVKPIYPQSMREAGLAGVVPIEAVIGRDGTVTSVRVLSAQAHPDLAVAATDAVRKWRFTPTLLNGVAVDVSMTVTVKFSLSD